MRGAVFSPFTTRSNFTHTNDFTSFFASNSSLHCKPFSRNTAFCSSVALIKSTSAGHPRAINVSETVFTFNSVNPPAALTRIVAARDTPSVVSSAPPFSTPESVTFGAPFGKKNTGKSTSTGMLMVDASVVIVICFNAPFSQAALNFILQNDFAVTFPMAPG